MPTNRAQTGPARGCCNTSGNRTFSPNRKWLLKEKETSRRTGTWKNSGGGLHTVSNRNTNPILTSNKNINPILTQQGGGCSLYIHLDMAGQIRNLETERNEEERRRNIPSSTGLDQTKVE